MSLKFKICGMKFPDNIAAVAALEPDYLGFIFYGESKRYVGPGGPELLQPLPENIIKTGVFVNASPAHIRSAISRHQLGAVQLHGQERPEDCLELRPFATVIKAFGLDAGFDFSRLNAYRDAADYFLFDTRSPGHGGSGTVFDWQLLQQYTLDIPYFLSGGIGPESVAALQALHDPRLYALDLNSRFELSPGLKDTALLAAFKKNMNFGGKTPA